MDGQCGAARLRSLLRLHTERLGLLKEPQGQSGEDGTQDTLSPGLDGNCRGEVAGRALLPGSAGPRGQVLTWKVNWTLGGEWPSFPKTSTSTPPVKGASAASITHTILADDRQGGPGPPRPTPTLTPSPPQPLHPPRHLEPQRGY